MCNYKTLGESEHDYVIQCCDCNHIQVAFATTILSLTRAQFYDYLSQVHWHSRLHKDSLQRDRKIVTIGGPIKGVAMTLTVRELCSLRYLISEGRKNLEYSELFAFSEN